MIHQNLTRCAKQVSVITCLMSECAVLLAVYYQNPYSPRILSSLCPGSSPSLSTLSIVSPSFLLGINIMLSSAALRVWCYDTLGSFFTFEVTINRAHKLITSGPYAYVRHPGYTAAVVMFVGATVTCMAPGGHIDECDIMATKAGWWVRMWLGCALFVTASLWRRGRIEDGGLRRAFGEVWDDYSQAVPCRFVPGLL
jgi:protein-S-isoprenylcysteine O-methyltransferase Ste14